MKRSRKVSAASIVALSLPLAGVGVAAAQQIVADPQTAANGSVRLAALRSTTENGNEAEAPSPDDSEAASAEAPQAEAIDPMRGWSEEDMAAYQAYWEAGYSYGQLLALAEEWNMSEFEAKAQAGYAILADDTASFDGIVEGVALHPSEVDTGEEYAAPSESYWAAGYDYDDAVVLAEAWNTSPYEAKVLAGELIDNGDVTEIQTILGEI